MIKKIFVAALFFRLVLSFGPYHPDLGNHLDWGIKFWSLGPKYFYENLFWQVSWANQPPGTIYIFALMRKIYEGIFAFFWWLNLNFPVFPSNIIPFLQDRLYVLLVKLPAMAADLGMAYLIYKFVGSLRTERWGKVAAGVFLFNPVVWYNSAVWGQTDALVNFFGLWSVYLFWRRKTLLGLTIFLFSLYFKGSLLIFLPVILILAFKNKGVWWRKILVFVFVPILLAYLSFPFVRWMTPVPWLYHLYRDRVFGHQGNMLTANAFNLWAAIFGVDFSKNDLGTFLGLNYKVWGQFLLALVFFPVLVNLLIKKLKFEEIFWSLATFGFASFLFLTNMHERYLYPVFPFLTILLFLYPPLKHFYVFLSLGVFLNLYHLWYVPDILGLRHIFVPVTIRLFSVINLIFFGWFILLFLRFLRFKKV